MMQPDCDPAQKIQLDPLGRMTLSDSDLERVREFETAIAGGANSLSCAGTTNHQCTNTFSCGGSTNLTTCTNSFDCTGTKNRTCGGGGGPHEN